MQFIKLTDMGGQPVFINFDTVTRMAAIGLGTTLYFTGGAPVITLEVSETPEEIIHLLGR